MQIDWITVVAQAVNFLVLVWILNRLLFRPVSQAMARRETAIRDRFAEAEAREAQAAEEAAGLAADRAALAASRAGVMAEAAAEAEALRHRLDHEARDAIERQRAAWAEQLARDQAGFLTELQRRVAGHVDQVARRVLTDFASAGMEAAMAETFATQLRALRGDARDALRAEAEATGGKMRLRSTFPLPPEIRDRLTAALRETVHDAAEVDFAADPDLICGLRLTVGGQTVQWSVDAYLDDLAEETAAYLEMGAGAPDLVAER